MTAASKPVKLQINAAGAWRDVISFNAANDIECAEVMSAGETLGRVGKATLRVVMANSPHPRSPEVLLRWSRDDGWKESK